MKSRRANSSLAFVNVAGALIIVTVAASRPLFSYAQSHYEPKQVVALRNSLPGDDPKVGSTLTLVGFAPSKGAGLVVALSDCAPCNQTKLDYAYELASTFKIELRVLVCNDTQLAGADQLRAMYPHMQIRAASSVEQKTLNIFFLPRTYATDAEGRLAYVQSLKTPFEEAVRKALIEIQKTNR